MQFKYQAFGVSFELPFRAATRLETTKRPAELVLLETDSPPGREGDLIYESPRRLADGDAAVSFRRSRDTDVLCFANAVEFQSPSKPTVRFRRLGSMADEQIEAFVLSSLLPLRLEWTGLISVHCSAVKIRDGVIGFLGNSGAGKSSVAAGLLRRGHRLVAEDVLPLDARSRDSVGCVSAYPELKVASPVGEHCFGREFTGLREERFHGGKRHVPVGESGLAGFAAGRHDLAALFVLDRRSQATASADGRKELAAARLAARQTALELLRFSFHARLVEALGLAGRRLEALARVAERVPVFRLRYPSGLEHLDEVCEVVEDRVRGLGE